MNDQKPKQESVRLEELQIINIIPSGDNPRTINEKSPAFLELAASIQAQGVIVPVHVRIHPKKKGRFELLAGERRLKAATKAGRGLIPAINHGKINDEAAFEITFTENYAREDLTPLEQGRAVVTLMEKFKGDTEAVASKMGKSIKWVRQRQALGTKLSKTWRTALVEEDRESNIKHWTAGHLQLIASLPDSLQEEMLEYYHWDELPTIKQLDGHIAEMLQLLSKALFNTDEAGCSKCQKRTSCQPGLFDDDLDEQALKKNDRCLDRDCWAKKTAGWLKATYDVKKKELTNLLPIATEYIDQGIKAQHQEVFGQVLEHYNFKQVSKKGKGAIPGFIIHGKALGTILWVKPTSSAAESRAKKSTGKPTPLKERRDMLNRKRWAQVLRYLVKEVEKATVDSIFYEFAELVVMSLASIVGTFQKHDYLYKDTKKDGFPWEKLRKINEQAKTAPGEANNQVVGMLWEEVRPVLTSRLTYNDTITRTPDAYIKEAKNVAILLNIDIDAIFKKVAENDCPEPKSWKNLNADGTPKKTKSKTAKKKSIKEKKSTKVRTCRECGCTDDKPCIIKEGPSDCITGPCHWVEKDLCSACAEGEKKNAKS